MSWVEQLFRWLTWPEQKEDLVEFKGFFGFAPSPFSTYRQEQVNVKLCDLATNIAGKQGMRDVYVAEGLVEQFKALAKIARKCGYKADTDWHTYWRVRRGRWA